MNTKITNGITKFEVESIIEGDVPNIFIRRKSDNSLFAKVWAYPDGSLEMRRFMKNKDVACFIEKDGKMKKQEYKK